MSESFHTFLKRASAAAASASLPWALRACARPNSDQPFSGFFFRSSQKTASASSGRPASSSTAPRFCRTGACQSGGLLIDQRVFVADRRDRDAAWPCPSPFAARQSRRRRPQERCAGSLAGVGSRTSSCPSSAGSADDDLRAAPSSCSASSSCPLRDERHRARVVPRAARERRVVTRALVRQDVVPLPEADHRPVRHDEEALQNRHVPSASCGIASARRLR